ncbi:MAG: polyprenyl synthetase family protein [Bdellovibrionota bacterium]
MLDKISKKIIDHPALQAWPDIEAIISKRKPGILALFDIAYMATGHKDFELLPIQAAIGCFVVNCILIDDILDGDEKGAWKTTGVGSVANLTAALHARQSLLIHEANCSEHKKQIVSLYMSQMELALAWQQQIGKAPQLSLEHYWKVVDGKTSNVCGVAMKLGAVLGEADAEQMDILYDVGHLMGDIGQVSNDLRGAFENQVNPDWHTPACSLPILLALTTSHSQAEELKQMIHETISPGKILQSAQAILIESGAVAQCCDQIANKLQSLLTKLCACQLAGKQHLHASIGEDIQHAIMWVKKLEIDLLDHTTGTLDEVSKGVASLLGDLQK